MAMMMMTRMKTKRTTRHKTTLTTATSTQSTAPPRRNSKERIRNATNKLLFFFVDSNPFSYSNNKLFCFSIVHMVEIL